MGIAMTKNPVGVNGIDPVRQCIKKNSIDRFFRSEFLIHTLNPIGQRFPGSVSIDFLNKDFLGHNMDSLANRANAIRPYGILRHRWSLKWNVIRVVAVGQYPTFPNLWRSGHNLGH